MNYHQATALGETILASPRADLIAIGRFVPVAELDGNDSWGCSVHLINSDGPGLKTVWSRAEWESLLQSPRTESTISRPVVTSGQPTLF